ncbi:MAG: DUF4157 domain-containing protein [Betaproteobacteria bacterium]|nr:DUF4157 domain-containing protein [Betaproteobacteria bacterium]
MKTHAKLPLCLPFHAHSTPTPNVLSHQAQHRDALLRAGIQPRLKIGAVNDPLEREADATAKRVTHMPEPTTGQASSEPRSQPPQATLIQTKASAPAPAATTQVSPQIESSLSSLNSGGAPLDTATRAFFEPRFGQDFSQVRIHTGGNAAQMNESLNAKAFTLGNDIAFAPNQFSANTSTGRDLLGHELAHVVQQRGMNGGVGQTKMVQRNAIMPKSTGWEPPSPEEIALLERMAEIRRRMDKKASEMSYEQSVKYWDYRHGTLFRSKELVEINDLFYIRAIRKSPDYTDDNSIFQAYEKSLNDALYLGPVQVLSALSSYNWAHRAVRYVKSVMRIGAGNKPTEVFTSFGRSYFCVKEQRKEFKKWGTATTLEEKEEQIRKVARIATLNGCGNCAEQSFIALLYLADQGVRPVEVFAFKMDIPDHAYVVIGRQQNSEIDKPETWGDKAFICDPWYGRVYRPAVISYKWPSATPVLLYSFR